MSDPDTGKQDDNAALIALRDLPSQLRDDAIGHAPRRAERLLAAADEIERLRRELAEVQTKYGLLSSAINESTDECGPDCDDYGHGDKCPSLYPPPFTGIKTAIRHALPRQSVFRDSRGGF